MLAPKAELTNLATETAGGSEARSAFPHGLAGRLVGDLVDHQGRMQQAAEANRQALAGIAPFLDTSGIFGEQASIVLFALGSDVKILLDKSGQVLRQDMVDQGRSTNVRPANDEEMRELFSDIVFALKDRV